MTRGTEKKLVQTFSKFEVNSKMVKKACHPTTPSLEKSLEGNRKNMDLAYQELFHDFKLYKNEVDDAEFNEKDENGKDKYIHNDEWFEKVTEEYFGLVDSSDTKLESLATKGIFEKDETVQEKKDDKVATQEKLKTLYQDRLKGEKKAIGDSITNTSQTLSNMQAVGVAQSQAMKGTLRDISDRLDGQLQNVFAQLLPLLDQVESKSEQSDLFEFCSTQRARIDSIEMAIIAKVRDNSATNSSFRTTDQTTAGKTFLKKVDPPSFSGDILDFPEFKRKWKANVTRENLEEESELDRLRDHVPDSARKMLIGEKKLESAWKILTKLYGNKTMLANKLKAKLKNIRINGKEDHDVVINLAIEVKTIVKSLTEVDMADMLKYDDEYLSAIFRALPYQERTKWLNFEKDGFSCEWEAMEAFIEDAHEKATKTKILLSNYAAQDSPSVKKLGHKRDGPELSDAKVGAVKSRGYEESDEEEEKPFESEKKRLRELCGKCPLCKTNHNFKRRRDGKILPSDRFSSCEKFREKSEKERATILEKHKACSRCLSWNHKRDSTDCKAPKNACNVDKGSGNICKSDHSRMVCGSGSVYCASAKFSNVLEETSTKQAISPLDLQAETLMLLEDVRIKSGTKLSKSEARILWDGGSNRVLIDHNFAKEQKLRKQQISYKLSVVGGKENIKKGVIYEVEVLDNSGNSTKVWGFGIDCILDPPDPVDLRPVRHLFPHVPEDVFEPLPRKRIDVLVGLNFFSLHPSGGQGRNCIDNLKVLHSKFSRGWLVGGSHPDLLVTSPSLTSSALCLARVCRVQVKPEFSLSSDPAFHVGFWESESLGVLPAKRCGRCLQCSECQDSALVHSRKEQDELDMLRKSIKLENGKLLVSFPFLKNPESFPNNRHAALSMAQKQEARLLKKGLLDRYNEEFNKYLMRGGLVPISKQEMEEYSGPVNYISHHGVEQPASTTTPLRLVSNSSLKNGLRSLNDILPKGPKSLNSMFGIMIRFRAYEVALVFDLTKAYNSLITGLVEKHMRRVIWRLSPSEPWQDYGFTVVGFGDIPAATLLELGKSLTADAGVNIDPVASRKLKQDFYVDDAVTGGSRSEVNRFKGSRSTDGKYTGTFSRILGLGNLNIKVMVASGETDPSAMDLLGNKVLGYKWEASSDVLAVNFPVNISGTRRKQRLGPDLKAETLHLLLTTKLTKRICLGITNGFSDFLGLACPFTHRFKQLMKQIFEDEEISAWNDEIKEDAKLAWIELIRETVLSDSLCFPRATRPPDAIGSPRVVGFDDGSFQAFAAAVYLVWERSCQHKGSQNCEGDFSASLLCAKSRVTPLTGLTIPRSELCGVVLNSRLCLTVCRALSLEKSLCPSGVIMLSDSECSISAVDKTSSALKPYFHNRVSEIRENMRAMSEICEVEELHHVAGIDNIADIATHSGVKLSDLGPGSPWQTGPSFLCSRRDLWPVSREFVKKVPDDEVRCVKTNVFAAMRLQTHSCTVKTSLFNQPNAWDAIIKVMTYSNSYRKVRSILTRVLRGWKCGKTKDIVSLDPVAIELQESERLILMSAMPESYTALKEGKLDSLLPKKKGLMLVTTGRIGEKPLSRLLGVDCLPILMPNTRAAYLFMYRAHCGDSGYFWNNMVHKSAVETLARSRAWVWIMKGKSLAKQICKSCPMCIRRRRVLCKQQIAEIKPQNLEVCKPWTFVSLDFAGPVLCKGVVNSRARRKCWILVYVDRSTKAVCLLACPGYDTASFLLRHEEFVARKGEPREIISDQGSQLLSAGVILAKKESPEYWDWERIKRENATTSWIFIPVGSHHHNGLPEAMVKVMKTSLSQALNPGVILSYEELVTLLARISCSINSRPLGLGNISSNDQQEDFLQPITPNQLLLGRSSPESPPLDYAKDDKFCQRLAYVAAVEDDWWEKWISQVLPTLLPARKWRKEQQNLVVGDVVMLTYPGNFKDDYVLARVTELLPDAKGLVRRVKVKFRKKNTRESRTKCKSKMMEEIIAVQRLCLLEPAPRGESTTSSPPTGSTPT